MHKVNSLNRDRPTVGQRGAIPTPKIKTSVCVYIYIYIYVIIVFVLETNDCLSALDLAALLMLNFEYASFFS